MRIIVLTIMLLFSLNGLAKTGHAGDQGAIIKSEDGVCHPLGSKRHKTKSKRPFTTFKTLDECLKSGGKTRNAFPGHTV